MDAVEITPLFPEDLEQILSLERRSFADPLQADEETILRRFSLGHIMIGAREEGALAGMVAFSYARFSPDDRGFFPRTFRAFSTLPVPENYNAAFIYNLEIDPARRGRRHARALLSEAFNRAKRDGCTYVVGDGRPSSYAGSAPCAPERVRANRTFKESVDRYLNGGPFPTKEEFLADPTLALYHRLSGCEFWAILPDFFPEDVAAGGIRVIVYGQTATWNPTRPRAVQGVMS